MQTLTSLKLRGYKSIRDLNLPLGRLNILIGANGAGKSNLISFFKLLNWMTPSPGNLEFFVGKFGGANSLLHDGAAVTPQLEAELIFETGSGVNEYRMRLFHAAQDTLVFADEQFRFSGYGALTGNWRTLGAGHRETGLIELAERGDKTALFILGLLKRCVVYQFHNTSETARVRQRWDVDDNRLLKEDAANLAPFLLRLRDSQPLAYARIVETIRQIAPFFADFVLEPVGRTVILQWRERNTDIVFGPHQASDGTLRMMALVALLLQPEADLPTVIILDEPELGLHPYAINTIAGLFQSVSNRAQVLLATQSASLVDCFQPADIIVVDRVKRESCFQRLDAEKLKDWLAEYSVAQLWKKNVIGGRPSSGSFAHGC
jgi:predicted ATPase